VQSWVKAFLDDGLQGLMDEDRGGRPRRLSDEQLDEIKLALRLPPENFGLSSNLWDGRTLQEYIDKFFGIEIGVRQCQRLFRQLGFGTEARPMIVGSSSEDKGAFKKN
jgi:transposase